MALMRDDATTELVGGVRAARSAAHELVGDQLARGKARLKSSSKTRKSALTRKKIMTAASELMAERGNTNFQMSEVSDRCHMSKGALYYYFSDKDELIAAIFDESVDELVGGMEALVAKSPSAREALSALYAEFSRRLRTGSTLSLALTYQLAGSDNRPLSQVTSHFARAAAVIAAQLERAKSEGLVRPDVDTATAATFATGGLITVSMSFAAGQATAGADVISSRLMELILRGVGTEGAAL